MFHVSGIGFRRTRDFNQQDLGCGSLKRLDYPSELEKVGDRYSAIRARLLIVRRELDEYRDGNVKESHPISVDSISIETAHQTVTVLTDTMTAGLRFAVSQRVLDQLSSKISSELGSQTPGFSGKLGSELLAKSESEFTETMEESLSGTRAFQITESEERKHSITLNSGEAREAKLRLRYWPRRWDVYLHSYEAIEFEYKKRWFWRDVRKTMKIAESQVLGWSTFSVNYYEPQTNLVVTYCPVADELTEPDEVSVSPLSDPMTRATPPRLPSLSDLAKLAFPVTKQERVASQVYVVTREREAAGVGTGHRLLEGPGWGRGVKRAPAKKAAKKAVARAVKNAAKKAPAKKAAKKAARKH